MGKLCREKPKNEQDWILARAKRGIGGSDAANIVGISAWKNASELWQEMVGERKPQDISNNPLIEQGHRMEKPIRDMYKTYHKDRKVTYHKYDLLYQSDRPWLFATLDGEITLPDKRRGILECKTSTPIGKAAWEKWNYQVPDTYLIQALHQMLATGWDFVDLVALLINKEEDFTFRTYRIERAEHEEEMAWLLEKETEFWDSVQHKKIPPMTLVF